MREILFRGKRKDNDEWVQGDFCSPCNIVFLEHGYDPVLDKNDVPCCNDFEVIPETVGQYTGLKDKNGKKIFEGDVVNVNTNKDTLCHRYEGRHLVIRFDEYHRFVASGRLEYPLCNHYEWEIIGNIHDNPELLREYEE